jgi:hypothetical protein
VLLDNGTPLRWPWPSYGAELPRDLVHYLVETRLGIRHGFWGLVADGINFGYLSTAADQTRAGVPPSPPLTGPEVDLTELVEVECVARVITAEPAEPAGAPGAVDGGAAVGLAPADPPSDATCLRLIREACAARGVPVPAALDARSAGAPEKAVGELRSELSELTARWRALAAGRCLVLPYSR